LPRLKQEELKKRGKRGTTINNKQPAWRTETIKELEKQECWGNAGVTISFPFSFSFPSSRGNGHVEAATT
jgi:hypothetical protein